MIHRASDQGEDDSIRQRNIRVRLIMLIGGAVLLGNRRQIALHAILTSGTNRTASDAFPLAEGHPNDSQRTENVPNSLRRQHGSYTRTSHDASTELELPSATAGGPGRTYQCLTSTPDGRAHDGRVDNGWRPEQRTEGPGRGRAPQQLETGREVVSQPEA